MTLVTRNLCMFAGQLENDIFMIEISPISVNAVMAGQAVLPICMAMDLHELKLDFLVTDHADRLVEFGKIIPVAIVANKRRTIGLFLVGEEGITSEIMREIHILHIGQRCFRAAMIRVTFSAGNSGITLVDHAMD